MFAMRCADQVHESLRLKFHILKHPHYQGAEKMNINPVLIFSIHERLFSEALKMLRLL